MPVLPSGLRWLPWGMLIVLFFLGSVGLMSLYSAANGSFSPWVVRQATYFVFLIILMMAAGWFPSQLWAKLAYPFYGISLLLLTFVQLFGKVGMGAQRWISLGVVKVQPSELMKIAVVLALARFYKRLPLSMLNAPLTIIVALAIIMVPAGLVLLQPDLGTALMIISVGILMVFLAGTNLRFFIIAGSSVLALAPIAWAELHDYQKNRVLTFLDPERDPLGQGYHITQSKIAIGSGGLLGKGFLNGSQANLEFLPEAHTDFIFSSIVEEWGMVGGLALLFAYGYIIKWGNKVGSSSDSLFFRLLAYGLSFNIFLYVCINVGMVLGLLPVVGIPLPLMSYGGSAMMSMLLMLGILLSIHRYNRGDVVHVSYLS